MNRGGNIYENIVMFYRTGWWVLRSSISIKRLLSKSENVTLKTSSNTYIKCREYSYHFRRKNCGVFRVGHGTRNVIFAIKETIILVYDIPEKL